MCGGVLPASLQMATKAACPAWVSPACLGPSAPTDPALGLPDCYYG